MFENYVCCRGDQGIPTVCSPRGHTTMSEARVEAPPYPPSEALPGFRHRRSVTDASGGAGHAAQRGVGVVCLFEMSAGWAESEARVGSVVEVVIDEHDVLARSVEE
jgi:hypothetical protein